jgi:uncharacterized protein
MIKVVLDTNVLISGILTPKGKSAHILKLVAEEKIILFISKSIINEIRRVLNYPKLIKYTKKNNLNFKEINEHLEALKQIATQTPDKIKIDVIKDDPSDNIILTCALEGKVDYIISGDSHLKDLVIFKDIKIISPADFLDLISK